ncbi:citramalate synthase [Caldivirga sp.]|uniref:citramalate synthase n=1 Tax=Caldivirga sp. TaxID=2080243 RepID=UPI003D0CCFB9
MDTTLRDGAQGANISFTLNDKVRLTLLLDELGVDYVEGGWPGSNPKDEEYFREIRKYSLRHAKVAAFSSTRRRDTKPSNDPSLNAVLRTGVDTVVLFGKSWVLHVTEILRVSKEDNLEMIYDSVNYMKSHGLEVIFDAEHFYQGFKEDPDYALSVVKTAEDAGARVVVLADTNGAMMPNEVYEITRRVVNTVKVKVGLHMHNDSGCAVANTIMGVLAGARHVQGTINGIGERTGNADLIQVIPNLLIKVGLRALNGPGSLRRLREVSKLVYELAGLQPNPYQPYVGDYAFTHKAGVHVDAVLKNPRAYEHIDPEVVGNSRRFILSELSGSSNLVVYLEENGIKVDKRDERVKKALMRIKELENRGYSFDLAPASAVLIALRELNLYRDMIRVEYWRVIDESGMNLAVVKVNGQLEVAEGVGPVHAVDLALRRALQKVYPELSGVTLTDYRVVLPSEVKNTESLVRVTAEFTDGVRRWRTIGVSTSVIKASIEALVSGLDYYLQLSRLRAIERTQSS